MPTPDDRFIPGYPRLVWDQDQSPSEPDTTDATLAAGLARASTAMEHLVATIREAGYATDPRRVAIELALTRIDEQMMLATRALFALPDHPLAVAPAQAR